MFDDFYNLTKYRLSPKLLYENKDKYLVKYHIKKGQFTKIY